MSDPAQSVPSSVRWNENDSTRPSLLDGLRAEDKDAWLRLVAIWTPLIYRRCRNQQLSHEDAEDVAQMVMARIFAGFHNFRRDGRKNRFRYWVSRIVRNEIINFHRKNGKHPSPVGGEDHDHALAQLPGPDSDDDLDVDWCHPTLIVARALDVIRPSISEQTWHAFKLVKYEGFQTTEAARILGTTSEAVRAAIHRIKTKLKVELEGMLD